MSNQPLKLRHGEVVLLGAAIRLNTLVSAAAFALLSGSALWLATVILVVRGGSDAGQHLQLLSVFMAGYTVTWAGAWIGFLWGAIYGALSGGILYWTYARSLRPSLLRDLVADDGASALQAPTLLLSGRALGTGLGSVIALQLFVATSWLVVRGTADESSNAALLGQYLPGYTVSFGGAAIGAVQLFAIMFIAAHIVSITYNRITRARHQR